MTLLSLALSAAFGAACGKLKPKDATGAAGTSGGAGHTGAAGSGGAGSTGHVPVTISGLAAPHPLNAALNASEDFSMLKVAVVNPSAVLTDPNAPPLGAMALNTSATNCDTMMDCLFSLSGIDLTNVTLGLVGTLEDTRTGDARVWVKTGTGMGTGAFLTAVRKAPGPITDRRAFAVSRKLEAKLGAFAGTILGAAMNPGELEARGFLIGHVVDRLSSGPVPAGVAGATVTAGCQQLATGCPFDVIYPDATFMGKGAATAATGLFLVVPKTAAPVVTSWDVVPPPNDERRWEQHLAGSNPNNAFVIILPANELTDGGAADGLPSDGARGDGDTGDGGTGDGVTGDRGTGDGGTGDGAPGDGAATRDGG